MSDLIDIAGLDRAAVLAALFNRSKPLGMGFLQPHAGEMTLDEARALLASESPYRDGSHYFDYLRGRVMKICVDDGNRFNPRLYDRDNGFGAAKAAVDFVREQMAHG